MILEPKFGKSLGVVAPTDRGTDLVGRVTGHHLIDGGCVIEQAVGRVAHRPDHRELVIDLGQLGQVFRVMNSSQLRRDRLKDALDVIGHVLFGSHKSK